ncbi:MAG: ATP-binding protein [Clostridia bacterium]
MNDIKETVLNLIAVGKEGDHWDFKLKWHDNMKTLIKDIVCFANTSHDEDCYLIFGVSDDRKIIGLTERRKQVEIIDTMSHLPFAADNAPQIEVVSTEINGQTIDVLIILNSNSVPYYLKSDYGAMKMGCIYTRVGDKNTADNSNADFPDIERLWKKRFSVPESDWNAEML